LPRLLIETDSPDILPSGAPGPHNEPANLLMVVGKISEILGETPEKIASLTYENAHRLFSLPASAAIFQTRSPAPAD
jgi:TatD DNase family protein